MVECMFSHVRSLIVAFSRLCKQVRDERLKDLCSITIVRTFLIRLIFPLYTYIEVNNTTREKNTSLRTFLFTIKINVGKFFLNEITNVHKYRCFGVHFRCFVPFLKLITNEKR